ncbi:sigma-70 family RNA polymerase sigma factor [Actinomycetospora straminea]|uniref:RNA polymerase sigma factor SigM n=1 Tax=Actinomycetospora straminea TaxID=663607 RepID=A0ABP9F645_9PSEU|nr:sigma-70 family RNA polymerase sigma factor [Actinomycetospora straminea]MDD7933715.1 sigma-70 family RNA polymerase sigma factor [Actinomycetospora straminea]
MTDQPTEDPRTDAELLAYYVVGDGDALAVLVHRHQRLLLWIVRNLPWFEPEPEVVVQEVWLRVMRGAATFSGRSKVLTWLHRITVNEAISASRRRRASHSTPAGEIYETEQWADPDDGVTRVDDREHAAAALPELLALLPREQRLALEVLHLDGLSITEAAELLGVAEGTIKSRVHRAQTTIRQHLAARDGRQEFLAAWPTARP